MPPKAAPPRPAAAPTKATKGSAPASKVTVASSKANVAPKQSIAPPPPAGQKGKAGGAAPSAKPSASATAGGSKASASTSAIGKGLNPLVQTKNIFVRKTDQDMDAFSSGQTRFKAFEILSTQEELIYFAVDITEMPPLAKFCPCLAPVTFTVRILNKVGREEMLLITGHLGKGSKAEVKSGEEFYGYVHLDQENPAEVSYTGFNNNGDTIFAIKSESSGAQEFKIYSPNGKTTLGQVTQNWTATQPKYPEWFTKKEIYGLSFPKEFSLKSKAVLLGAAILLYFHHFKGRMK